MIHSFAMRGGELDPDLIDVESYTLSSFIIEEQWKELKADPDAFSTEGTKRIPLTTDFWKQFADREIAIAQRTKDSLKVQFDQTVKKPMHEWTASEKMVGRYLNLQRLKWGVGEKKSQETSKFGGPSFLDFISTYERLARVADEAFETQEGREPDRAEYENMLADPSFQNIMVQMMSNTRENLHWAFSLLESDIANRTQGAAIHSANTNDTSRIFEPQHFNIAKGADGLPILEINEKTADLIRKAVKITIDKLYAAGKKKPQMLRCPVMYTGAFKEMNDWMKHEVTFHYVDQKYPVLPAGIEPASTP